MTSTYDAALKIAELESNLHIMRLETASLIEANRDLVRTVEMLIARIADLETTAREGIDQIAPIVSQLQSSPILKMLL